MLLLCNFVYRWNLFPSSVNVAHFTSDLAGHPDKQAVTYVLKGLQLGFRLGFQPTCRLKAAHKNKPSAFQNPTAIDDSLVHGVSRCSVVGPFPTVPLPNLQISSFGVIPKKGQASKLPLICHGYPMHSAHVLMSPPSFQAPSPSSSIVDEFNDITNMQMKQNSAYFFRVFFGEILQKFVNFKISVFHYLSQYFVLYLFCLFLFFIFVYISIYLISFFIQTSKVYDFNESTRKKIIFFSKATF